MKINQQRYKDIAHRINREADRLFSLPHYAQVDDNLVNMANYFSLIEGLIDAINPRSICEIGSDQGATTELLTNYCKEHDCTLHSVDPVFEKTEQIDAIIHHHKCQSLDYLQENTTSDVYFIDGDHNHYTISRELKAIAERKPTDEPCAIFIHDVNWPWGCMDMYYNQDSIPMEFRKQTKSGGLVSLFADADKEMGEGLPMDGISIAVDPDEKSGSVPAIETFLRENGSQGWQYTSIPSLFGMGVLVHLGNAGDGPKEVFRTLEQMFQGFNAFLSILEFNRIRLLEDLNRAGHIWGLQQEVIQEYETKTKEQTEEICRMAAEEDRLRKREADLVKHESELLQQIEMTSTLRGWLRHRKTRTNLS